MNFERTDSHKQQFEVMSLPRARKMLALLQALSFAQKVLRSRNQTSMTGRPSDPGVCD